MADTGIVNIHGREYRTVAYRLNLFREDHPDWSIATKIVSIDDERVVVRTTIADENQRTISTGYAEEVRASSNINKTSALENAETSAVGRALAFYGLAGTEIASADEVANAIGAEATKSAFTSVQARSRIRNQLMEAAKKPDDEAVSKLRASMDNDQKAELMGILTKADQKLIKESLARITEKETT